MATRTSPRLPRTAAAAARKRRRSSLAMVSSERSAGPKQGSVTHGRTPRHRTLVACARAPSTAGCSDRVEATMPATYEIDRERRLVLSRGWGVFTEQDLLGHFTMLGADP